MRSQVAFGEGLKLVGNVPEMGDWNADKGAVMQWGEGDMWSVDTRAPVGVEVCFKVGVACANRMLVSVVDMPWYEQRTSLICNLDSQDGFTG